MKQILEVMGTAVQKFGEENQKFESLAGVMNHHLLEEKEKEIQRLEENLKFKNEVIRKLKKQLEEMETVKPQMEEPIPEKVEMKQESQQQKEQKVPEEFPQTEHISNPTQQERLGKFARLFGGRRKDLLDIALKQGLTRNNWRRCGNAWKAALQTLTLSVLSKPNRLRKKCRK